MQDHAFFLKKFAAIYPYSHTVWRVSEAAAEASFLPFRDTLLDLGCGDGLYFSVMTERVGKPKRAIGLDRNASEVAKAKKRGAYDEVIVAPSNAIPLPNASVDMVFSNSVVEHIDDKMGTISEVARVLKPGGVYLFSAPTEQLGQLYVIPSFFRRIGLAGVGDWWVKAINTKFHHVWLQSKETWEKDLAAHGLTLKKMQYTLTPENARRWERFIIPSYFQHVLMKRWGIVPFKQWTLRSLEPKLSMLEEDPHMKSGGNQIFFAEKTA